MNQINPNLFLLILISASIFFLSPFIYLLLRSLFKRERISRDDDQYETDPFQGRLQHLFHLHDYGLDQSTIDDLPVFLYKEIIGTTDPLDCAFCLSEFGPDDKLRLLTKCSHAFHVDCIDTWLLSHSTCPLCRSSLRPDRDLPSSSSPVTAAESSRYSNVSFASSSNVNEIVENVVHVKLGNSRTVGQKELDQRRCFSMGSYEYIMNESSLLRVAVKPSRKSLDVSNYERESFSVSSATNGESSTTDLEIGQTPSFARRTLMWL